MCSIHTFFEDADSAASIINEKMQRSKCSGSSNNQFNRKLNSNTQNKAEPQLTLHQGQRRIMFLASEKNKELKLQEELIKSLMPFLLAKLREETSHPPNHLFTIFSSSQMASPQTAASSVLIQLFTSETRDLEQHIRQPSITAVCRAMTNDKSIVSNGTFCVHVHKS